MTTAPDDLISFPSTPEMVQPRLTRWRRNPGQSELVEIVRPDPPDTPSLVAFDTYALAPSEYVGPRLLPRDEEVDEGNEGPREKLIALQSWEGTVLGIGDGSFVARLVDVNGEHLDEEVSLSTEELCDFDLALLEPGAIFYWTIGYRYQLGGARERVSRIRLRRLPAWTKSQLEEARERAVRLERDLDW